jgi:hypothetical protein
VKRASIVTASEAQPERWPMTATRLRDQLARLGEAKAAGL